jgi:hypothetical protein
MSYAEPTLEQDHVDKGRKLAEHLFQNVLTKEDPRTAMLALCLLLPLAARACRINVAETFETIRQFAKGARDFDRTGIVPGMIVLP